MKSCLSEASVERSPVVVLAITGNTAIRMPMAMIEGRPMPNQMMMIGATAITGMVWSTTV